MVTHLLINTYFTRKLVTAFSPPFYPTTNRNNGPFDLGGNPTDDAFAQADSWEKILQFLKDDT